MSVSITGRLENHPLIRAWRRRGAFVLSAGRLESDYPRGLRSAAQCKAGKDTDG